ncbi:uncharacterized protein LOC111254806 isoform X1 [Varroa destructor]|uniref:MYND-type domain-containing protein n=2 Tax=Varroa destructor TaxID=109461 RepID=A0A7M7KTK8_VARDE|nr:uncharacterized protein LOC111254806 isoform X1 [Varroa destructor]
MIKASHPSLATASEKDYGGSMSVSSVSNGKIGYQSRPLQAHFIEDYHSQMSSGRTTERALLQQGIMGLVGLPLRNGQTIDAERPDSGATIESVEDDYEPELAALADEISIDEEATLPALSGFEPEMTEAPLILDGGRDAPNHILTGEPNSPPFLLAEDGEEMLKYTIYEQRSPGQRNVIGTLTTVRGIPLNELRPALSQLAKGQSFYFYNDRTNLDVKNESLAIDRIFKNKALVIRFPQRTDSPANDGFSNTARNSVPVSGILANVTQHDEQRRAIDETSNEAEPMKEVDEFDDEITGAAPQDPIHLPPPDTVLSELHEVNLVSGRIAEGAPLEKTQKIEKSEEDELVPPAPELPLSPSAGQSSSNNSGNSSTHSVERGPSSTRSGGSYVGPLGLCHRPECSNAARVKCVSCGQVAYCSSKCLRTDAARHRANCYRRCTPSFDRNALSAIFS